VPTHFLIYRLGTKCVNLPKAERFLPSVRLRRLQMPCRAPCINAGIIILDPLKGQRPKVSSVRLTMSTSGPEMCWWRFQTGEEEALCALCGVDCACFCLLLRKHGPVEAWSHHITMTLDRGHCLEHMSR